MGYYDLSMAERYGREDWWNDPRAHAPPMQTNEAQKMSDPFNDPFYGEDTISNGAEVQPGTAWYSDNGAINWGGAWDFVQGGFSAALDWLQDDREWERQKWLYEFGADKEVVGGVPSGSFGNSPISGLTSSPYFLPLAIGGALLVGYALLKR